MIDCDVGKTNLNFMLEPSLIPFAGADSTCIFPEGIVKMNATIEVW